MRGIERVVAALLLAGAVAGAIALPRLAAGPDSTAPFGRIASPQATTIVDAAPLPAPKPKVVHVGVLHAAHTPVVAVAHPRITVRPRPVQRAPHVPAVAPEPQLTPAPPVLTPSPPATPTVSPSSTPAPLAGLAIGRGKGHAKKGDEPKPIELPQVQVQAPPADNGNGNGNSKSQGHGHDKGA
ncbi:MAG TPA: hypothetical protein VLE97_04450 [Gaiellaceae bacterium]|nr:hypothetical protein [Gaiellaceae bacterium]